MGGFKPGKLEETANAKGNYKASLPLLTSDKTITFRIFLDNVAGEAYWQDGRVAMTLQTHPADSVLIQSTAATVEVSATSYSMGSVYTSVDDVLTTPRTADSMMLTV